MEINTDPPNDLERLMTDGEEFVASQGEWILSEHQGVFKLTHTTCGCWAPEEWNGTCKCEVTAPKEIGDFRDVLNMGATGSWGI